MVAAALAVTIRGMVFVATGRPQRPTAIAAGFDGLWTVDTGVAWPAETTRRLYRHQPPKKPY